MNGRANNTTKAIALSVAGVLALTGMVKLAMWGFAYVHEQRNPPPPNPLEYALHPSPVRTPAGVVVAQLGSLRANQAPVMNSGLATLYNFMEPSMQERIGHFMNLETTFMSSQYADLFTISQARLGPLKLEDNVAQQVVSITLPDRKQVVYAFTLALQTDGPYKDCWMTRDIARLDP